jgi:ribonuclease HII
MLTVGIDEVGYGPKLGPLVVAAAAARGPLPRGVRVGDSKKVFSQARGVGSLEPAVLGFLPSATFAELLARLSAELPDSPWYRAALALPARPPLPPLAGAWARVVDPAAFNAATREQNKSEFLFELVAELVGQIRRTHPGPLRFVVGKQGGRAYYLRGIQERLSPTVLVEEETPGRSAYRLPPDASIEFLRDAEERHELVALASMIGKYVRELAMRLFNGFWTSQVPGLRPTAGYGTDARRFARDVEAARARLGIPREAVVRAR